MQQRKLAVVGLGYVGLPLAVLAQEKGWQVTGVDTNQAKVDHITAGHSPVPEVVSSEALQAHPITATSDPSAVASADMIVVAVPTPVTEHNLPDLRPLSSALVSILPHLKTDQVLSIESTVNPGVMDEVVIPLLRSRPDLNLDANQPLAESVLYLVHCPERVNPGDATWTVRNIPRVLGGYSVAGVKKAQEFYASIIEAPITLMGSATEAEAVKILENTFRDVNIAFINEMAQSFDHLGIDITNVIKGAATKPFAFMPHYPGAGVGGHCISVDPYYMIERAKDKGFNHRFLKLARQINDDMPAYTVKLTLAALRAAKVSPKRARVALLGLAYKKDIADLRESPALTIRRLLEDKKVQLRVYDPFVLEHSTVKSLPEALQGVDTIVLATAHSELTSQLTGAILQKAGVKIVIDGRNALNAKDITAHGVYYHGIGRTRSPVS